MTAPLIMSTEPLAPDQVAVPLLFSVRSESTTFEDAGKLMPAFALVVPLFPTTQETPLMEEHIVPPVQFNGVEKFRIPGAAPPRMPAMKLTVVVVMGSVAVPKFTVPPLKFTVPEPLIAPLCPNTLAAELMIPGVVGVNVPEQVDPQVPPPVNENVPLLPRTVPVLLKLTPMLLVVVPAVFSNVPPLLNLTAAPPPKTNPLSLV